jgi:teichuronopeptide biosynthesis TupA-like protein
VAGVRDWAKRLYHSPFTPQWVRGLWRRREARQWRQAMAESTPTTFNQMVRRRMALDRRLILATFVDKVAVRDYVRDRVGEQVLKQLYAVTDDPPTLVHADLPREFVLKVSHASGGAVFVGEHAASQPIPEPPVGWEWLHVHPDCLDWDRLVALCRHWLGQRFEPYREWAYSKVKPRILVEELLVSEWRTPFEYKFYTFHGTPEMVVVPVGRFGDVASTLYSPGWERLDYKFVDPPGPDIPRPAELDEMIAIVERLADGIDFVRVDLYNVRGRLVFGELTVYPNAGLREFDPVLEERFAALWRPSGTRARGTTAPSLADDMIHRQ